MFSLLFAALLSGGSIFATETIVIEATRLDAAAAEPGPSITVLEGPAVHQHASVGEVLRDLPGVSVAASGGAGQPAGVFIRGAPSEQTLVLWDGMEMNDPAGTARGFDFSNMPTDGVERIEVYRGPESLRFGPNAAGGVINIVSQRGHGPLRFLYSGEAGSYRTLNATLGVSGDEQGWHYSLLASSLNSGGFSAASGGPTAEADASRRLVMASRFGYDFSSTAGIEASVRAAASRVDLDYGGGAGADDPNFVSNLTDQAARLAFHGRSFAGRLASEASYAYTSLHREYDNDPDPVHTVDYHEQFRGDKQEVQTRQEFTFSDDAALEAVLQFRNESAGSHMLARHQNDFFGEGLIYKGKFGERFNVMAGVRHDGTSHSGEAWTYSVTPALVFGETTWRAGYSTGFRAPSLYQLYSSFGSPDLHSEKTAAVETSLERRSAGGSVQALTVFANQYRDLIDFDFAANKYGNVERAQTRGAEAQTRFEFSPYTLSTEYTYLEAHDLRDGSSLVRRPAHSFSVAAAWHTERLRVSAVYRGVGAREDKVGLSRVVLPYYDVVNLFGSYALSPRTRLQVRIENVFNRRYQEVFGYNTAALSAYAGVQGEF
jgi:vitamin B12 transporter